MKTIHTISAVISISLATFSHAENSTPQNKESLSISIIDIKMPTCNGLANGEITVEAVGGESPYSYNWNTFPNQINARAINLTAGVYFIHITDANGSVFYQSIELTDPIQTESKMKSVSPESPTTSIAVSSPTETEAYQYFLNGYQIEFPAVSGLDVGIHELVIDDGKGCAVLSYIQVAEMEQNQMNAELIPNAITATPFYPVLYDQKNSKVIMIKQ